MNNPQYHFTVTEKASLLVLLEQPDQRMKFRGGDEGMFPIPIGLTVLKVSGVGEAGARLPALPMDQLKTALVARSQRWPRQRDPAIELPVEPTAAGQPTTF
eukprot:SAG22_NODE_14907_length_362_cov_0.555133_1_plen_100_part_10